MRLRRLVQLVVAVCLLSSCAGMGVRSDAQSSFEQGLALFDQRHYDEAITHFTKATELDPGFARAYLYLGRSYLNLGRWLDAVAPLRTALRLSPEESQKEIVQILIDALLGAATSEFKQGNLQSSIGLLKDVLDLQPQSIQAIRQLVPALLALGGKSLSQGNFNEAINAYTEATRLAPKNFDAYVGLAHTFLQQKNFAAALGAIQDALRLSPSNLDALSILRQLQPR